MISNVESGRLTREVLQQEVEREERWQRCEQITTKVTEILAKTSAYGCCCCTFVGILIPTLLCYPCICYSVLNDKGDPLEKALRCVGCAMDERPPKNTCELCCTFCTPVCIIDLPDKEEFYTTAPKRQRMEERAARIETLKSRFPLNSA